MNKANLVAYLKGAVARLKSGTGIRTSRPASLRETLRDLQFTPKFGFEDIPTMSRCNEKVVELLNKAEEIDRCYTSLCCCDTDEVQRMPGTWYIFRQWADLLDPRLKPSIHS